MEELKEAIKNISNKKQPWHDKIFPEFFKNLEPKAIDTLLLIYNKFWKSNTSLLADWTKSQENQQKKWDYINQSLLPQSLQKFLKEWYQQD